MKKCVGILGVTALLLGSVPMLAQENIDTILLRDKLTGEWGGTRSKLADDGVNFDLSYTAYYQDLFSGTGDHEFQFGNRFDAFINLDFGKLGLWEGGGFHTHVEYNAGNLPGPRGGEY